MIFALGGNVDTNELPATVDARFADFILKLVGQIPLKMPKDEFARDAWGAYHKLAELRGEITGKKHQFLPFEI